MELPANLQFATLLTTTSATPNTGVSGVVIAAPGANLRYRVWGAGLSFGATGQAPGNTRILLQANAITSRIPRMNAVGMNSVHVLIPGGFAWPVNQSIDAFHQSSIASITIGVEVYYTIEATA